MGLAAVVAASYTKRTNETNAFVVARHDEAVWWTMFYARHFNARVFIYNDGEPILSFTGTGTGSPLERGRKKYYPPTVTQRGRMNGGWPVLWPPNITEVHVAQGFECAKYLAFIVDMFDHLHQYQWVVFLQGDPFHHSPDLLGLLTVSSQWKPPFQPLTYWAHPPPWGPPSLLTESSRKSFVGDFRVWCDPMDDALQGTEWKESWMHANYARRWLRTLSAWWKANKVPTEIPNSTCKVYAAMFAVTTKAIVHFNRGFYRHLLYRVNNSKDQCIQLEYVWQPLFQSTKSPCPLS